MVEHSTAGRTRKLTEIRRLDSADKTRRVLAALDATISAGGPLTIAALARHARVSRRFIDDHPELRAEAERRAAQTADRTVGAITAGRPESPPPRSAPTWPTPKPPPTANTPNWKPCVADSARSSAATRSPNSAATPTPTTPQPNSRTSSKPCPKRKSNSQNEIRNSAPPAGSTANSSAGSTGNAANRDHGHDETHRPTRSNS
jgi:hypothetical protein